jgi:hypothetical protein
LNAFARKFFKHKRNGAATYTQKPQNLMKPQRRKTAEIAGKKEEVYHGFHGGRGMGKGLKR